MQVPVKIKLSPGADTPTYAKAGDMCFDLMANLLSTGTVEIRPGALAVIPTGLSFELPPGWGLNVFCRSSTPVKKGLMLANGVGKIDNGYRGELLLPMLNITEDWVTINHGARLAQAEIVPIYQARFEVVRELSPTERGTGGFGSTGA